jgi:hypothetical protein
MRLFTPSPSKRRLLTTAAVFGALYGAILYSEGTANGGQPPSTEGLRGDTVDFCRSNAASSRPGNLPGLEEKIQAVHQKVSACTVFLFAGKTLWLFSMTWKNPQPDKKVIAVDCVSTLTEAAPFVVAMTLENASAIEKKDKPPKKGPAVKAALRRPALAVAEIAQDRLGEVTKADFDSDSGVQRTSLEPAEERLLILQDASKDQAPKTPKEAITAFQTQAKALVAGLTAEELRKTLESSLAASDKLEASRMTFSAARAHVVGSLTKGELKQRFLHGSIDDLRRRGDCWQVRSRDYIKANVEGYLEARTGKLVLFRFLPEG